MTLVGNVPHCTIFDHYLQSVSQEFRLNQHKCISLLENGYEELYDEYLPAPSDPLSHDDFRLVLDVLDIYRSIEAYVRDHPKDKKVAGHQYARFPGFDGDEETNCMAFAAFFIDKMGRYPASHHEDYNSHCPMIPKYRNMVSIWNTSEHELGVLTKGQVTQLLDAPYGSSVPKQP